MSDALRVRERWFSERVQREITVLRWGLFGVPVLVFPSAGGDATEIERNGLVDACGPLLAEGRVKLYSVDSVAGQAMVANEGPPEHRLWLLNQFHECVRWEVLPAIHADLGGQAIDVITTGASIGAFNAVAVLCRYPDVFAAAVGMSGTYRIDRFYDGAWSQDLYFSAPLQFLPGLEGPQLDRLRQRRVVLAAGEGEWEDIGESWRMAEVLGAKGIPNRVDNWGPQWAHQWPTWRQMLPQYLRELVPLRLGQLFDNDLVAQVKALGTDRGAGRGPVHRHLRHDGHAVDLPAVLPAERALDAGCVPGHRYHLAERGDGGVTGAEQVPGQGNAAVADVYARAGDQLVHLLLLLPAERAGQEQIAGRGLPLPAADPAAGSAGLLDDLVHPLVAEAQAGGDLAQRRAVQVQAPDGVVKLGPGHLGVALGIDQPFPGLPGLPEQLLVHAVYCN